MNLRWICVFLGLASAAWPAGAAEPPPGAAAPAAPATNGVLRLTVEQAVLLALENHPGLAAERMNPALQRTFEQEQRAAFDPTLSGDLRHQDAHTLQLSQSGTGPLKAKTKTTTGDLALGAQLPSGTGVSLDGSTTDNSLNARSLSSSRIGLTVSQALLRGLGTDVNLASLRQARLDTAVSEFEFRGYATAFVAAVEKICYDYALAGRQIEIYRESVSLAQRQADETAERIRLGKLAAVEQAAADAEVALRREDLIDAESARAATRLQLLGYLHLAGPDAWSRELAVTPRLELAEVKPDALEDHVRVARRLRPELNQSRLGLQRNELELVKTRNGLLPKLDAFVTWGETGYADSFGGSLSAKTDSGRDWQAGLSLEYALGDRQPQARKERAMLTGEQERLALDNLGRLVEVDVRSAYVELQRGLAQTAATLATRRLQEENVRAETEKFRVGKSTSLLVARAQRDLVQSEVTEARAVTGCFKALTDLERLDGSLLARRGIAVPGADTVPPAPGENDGR